jgi:hypothetical protein
LPAGIDERSTTGLCQIGTFYSRQSSSANWLGLVISHPYHRHENKQQSRVTSEESKLVRDTTHPLDDSLTSSDGSWSLKRAAELNKKGTGDSYVQSIRRIHHNVVCCRPVEHTKRTSTGVRSKTYTLACFIFRFVRRPVTQVKKLRTLPKCRVSATERKDSICRISIACLIVLANHGDNNIQRS